MKVERRAVAAVCVIGIIIYFSVLKFNLAEFPRVANAKVDELWDIVFPSNSSNNKDTMVGIQLANGKGQTDIIFRNSSTNNKGIMVGIQLTNGTGYTEFTASIIRKYHQINGSNAYIFRGPKSQYRKPQLTQWYGEGAKIVELESSATVLNKILETFIHSNYEILFLIDSNIVFLPGWSDFIHRHMRANTSSFLSLYHSAHMHPFTNDCQKYVGDLCEGVVPMKLGVALSKEVAKNIILSHRNLLDEFDWNGIFKNENMSVYYPKKSLIMNIGQKNQDEDFCGENEVPYGFNLCELPEWIKNGIEFYFDRCTNPQEFYHPDLSMRLLNSEKRLWARPAIAYSLYGNSARYTGGALANSKRVFSIYPGWKVWFFLDNSVPKDIVDQLCENNVRFVDMSETDIRNKRAWRFLIASQPVKMYAVRDVDSKLLERGKTAVDEWIKSGRKFHVMRDHVYHARYPINGGMFGGTRDAIPNMEELMKKYNGRTDYIADQDFLRTVVWNIVKHSVWAHDSHSLHKFGEDHDFATPWNPKEFVGQVNFH